MGKGESERGRERNLLWFLPGNNHLEHAHTGPALALPVLGVGVQPLQDVKGPCGIIELSHLVAVVGDELQQAERLGRCLHLEV